jgi:hypothetical protein
MSDSPTARERTGARPGGTRAGGLGGLENGDVTSIPPASSDDIPTPSAVVEWVRTLSQESEPPEPPLPQPTPCPALAPASPCALASPGGS